VGPTATELESIKELIQFDHEYYKTESSIINSAQQGVTILKKIAPKSNQKIFSIPAQDAIMESVIEPVNLEDENETVCYAELDLASYLQENMGSLMDLESLLGASEIPDSSAAVTDACSEDEAVYSPQNPPKSGTQTEDQFTDSTSKMDINLDLDMFNFSEDLILDPMQSPVHSLNEELPIKPVPSLSDSAYGSDLSDVGSPRSDHSIFDQDTIWHESFTELFPSLA